MARRASRTSFGLVPRSPRVDLLKPRARGFTIVELLIVVVVIAILAATTIVAYNGISQRAKASAAAAAAEQAAKKVMAYAITNAETYPATLSDAGVADANGTSFQYRVDNSSNPKTFCLTATSSSVSYWTSSTAGTPAAGACAGHGANGVVPIVNLATDPRATSLAVPSNGAGWTTSNWFGTGGAGSHTLVSSPDGPGGLTTYVRKTWSVAPSSNAATGIRNADTTGSGLPVSAGATYTFSSWLRASKTQSNAATILVEWVNASGVSMSQSFFNPYVTLPANTWTRLTATVAAPSGAAFVGIISHVSAGTTWSPGDTLDGTGLMVTQGDTLYAFADGASPGWAWNGMANNSTSTGPPL